MSIHVRTATRFGILLATLAAGCGGSSGESGTAPVPATFDQAISTNATEKVASGRGVFRFATFGDEAFWGDTLRLHDAIQGSALGGVGDGVSPRTALSVGLKVDADALPQSVKDGIANGSVDLDAPATTLALLKLNAVVGVTGLFFDPASPSATAVGGTRLKSIGIQCALCHSTVDDSFAPGIGRRLDGWPSRDLNVGAIVALAPNLQPVADLISLSGTPVTVGAVVSVLGSWGPGKFDAALFLDGKATNPNTGKSAATLMPAAFGLAGVNLQTYTGWGSVTYWNAFVANVEMHGVGTLYDPRLRDASKFPIAAAAGFGVTPTAATLASDRVTTDLAALHFYQLAIPAPVTTTGFDATAAARGKGIFNGKAKCATCHVPPLFTEPGWNMHTPAEVGIDGFQASRSPDGRYRTTPLGGLFTRVKGGFYHDGRFATLQAVVDHYDFLGAGLSPAEKADLVEYLKSL